MRSSFRRDDSYSLSSLSRSGSAEGPLEQLINSKEVIIAFPAFCKLQVGINVALWRWRSRLPPKRGPAAFPHPQRGGDAVALS